MVDAPTDWPTRLQDQIAQRAVNLARCELAAHGTEAASYARVELLAQIVQRVASHVTDPEAIPTWELLKFALDVMVFAGAGSTFALTDEFLGATTKIIDALAASGLPITDLLLARDVAGFADGGDERRAALVRAVTASRTAEERIRALTVLGRFSVDTSDYRNCRRHAATALRLAETISDGARYRPDLLATLGMSYYYTDLPKAEAYFHQAIREADALPAEPAVVQPRAEAFHYLGRIAAERGRPQEALHQYVIAQRLATKRLTGQGYHHLSLAEVLIAHGALEDALHHLRQSSRIFEQNQQRGTGQAHLAGSWARYFAKTGERQKAEQLLGTAITRARRDRYPRVELVSLIQLAGLRITDRRLLSALQLLMQAIRVYPQAELRGGWRELASRLVRAAMVARRLLRGSHSASDGTATVRCPCGADHRTQPVNKPM